MTACDDGRAPLTDQAVHGAHEAYPDTQPNTITMDKHIATQLQLATALAAMLQEDNEGLEDEAPAIIVADLLDAMARLGVYLVEMAGENVASLAYFAHLQAPEMKAVTEKVQEAAKEAERLRGRPELN